jgi:hypothetical protein
MEAPHEENGPPPPMHDDLAPPPPTVVAIPDRYNDPKLSGLTYTVVLGPQTHDISLEP